MELIEQFTFPTNDDGPETTIQSPNGYLWKGVRWSTVAVVKPKENKVGLFFGHQSDCTLPKDWSCSVNIQYFVVDESEKCLITGGYIGAIFRNLNKENCGLPDSFNYADIKSKVSTFPIVRIKLIVAENRSDRGNGPITSAIAQLFMNKTTSDVIIKVVDGGSFPAHKCILSARSEVFKTMLYCGMQESVSGEVLISDVDSDTMEAFLRYLYTDMCSVMALKTIGPNLLALAHQYQFQELVNVCVSHMTQTLDNDMVLNCLQLALKYDHPLLKTTCLKYIRQHKKEVFANISIMDSVDTSLLHLILVMDD